MHADENTGGLNEVPFDVPRNTLMRPLNDMHIHISDAVVWAARILAPARPPNNFRDILQRHLPGAKQILGINITSACVKDIA